jgi:hypothetical protein
MSMVSCGLDLDCDVPGEARFREKVSMAMSEGLSKSGKESLDIDEVDIDVDWVN